MLLPDAVIYLYAALAGLALGGAVAVFCQYFPVFLRRVWRGRPVRGSVPRRAKLRAWPMAGWLLARAWPWPELLLASMFMACLWRFGAGWLALCAMAYCLVLLVLAWVDCRSYLLPDALTLPLLWAGLLVNIDGAITPLPHAVLGAAAGYGVLWLFYQMFKLCTGREGMGFGDFKLTAALGAWLGLGMLGPVMLLAALAGVALGLAARWRGLGGRLQPFGPCLALAGVAGLLCRGGGLF
ncbi:prepilin peptidase [Bordetella avium]|nr:A24 family peptidase [Bordetella avium]RIQ15446.1 prepilin peptidase [Bordetella avium]RIQ38812.1 prepilin peptidase [Bordetella avium]RIQ43351.1 prepilin peptidase [Bordetella avium]RIQ44083.1 prepilin peptidase [Bordetella avium]RIQ53370.1 prepilin peptidase [Bordetella avium]